jgi:hypothetical protein
MPNTRASSLTILASISPLIFFGTTAHAAPSWSPLPGSSPNNTTGPNDEVNALHVAPATQHAPSRLLIGGRFTTITGSPIASPHLAAWDGSRWLAGPGLNNEVLSMCDHVIAGSPTIVAAGFSNLVEPAPSSTAYPLAFLQDGSWTGINLPGAGYIFGTRSFQLASDTEPQLALSSPLFHPFSYIAELGPLTTDGSIINANIEQLGDGLITTTKALCQFDDGQGPRLYVGAGADGAPSLGMLSRFDGSSWTNFTSVSGNVAALVVYDDGTGPAMYVAGSFTSIAGNTACSRIAKFKNGVFTPLHTGLNNEVQALAIHDDGTGPALYAAGLFSSAGGTPANRIAKWKNGQWSALAGGLGTGTGANAQIVNALASFDDDGAGPMPPALYAAGTFTSANGQPALRIARWGESFCAIDLDNGSATGTRDLAVDINDLLYFLSQFEAGTPAVDLDNDGDPTQSTRDNAVDINDLLFFLARFEAGC